MIFTKLRLLYIIYPVIGKRSYGDIFNLTNHFCLMVRFIKVKYGRRFKIFPLDVSVHYRPVYIIGLLGHQDVSAFQLCGPQTLLPNL